MFTFSPISERAKLLVDWVRTAKRDGEPVKRDPVVRHQIAQLLTDVAVARGLSLRFVWESIKSEQRGSAAPTCESSQYKLFATQLSQRGCNVALDVQGCRAISAWIRPRSRCRPLRGQPIGRRWSRPSSRRLRDPENILARRRLACRRTSDDGALDGIQVLDLSTVGPAARCTRILADYGAELVKVGAPAKGKAPIEPPYYAYSAGRGTRRIQLDLKQPDGVEAFHRLAERADVVVESFRPGVVTRLGIGYDAVRRRNPRIVYCSTSGYGQDGPRVHWAGHDLNYLAVSGFLDCSAAAPTRAAAARATLADSAGGGMHAAIAILAALCEAPATGEAST